MKIEIDGTILSKEETKLFRELITLGFDGMIGEWSLEEGKSFRTLIDKYGFQNK